MAAMKPQTRQIWDYIVENCDKDFTSADISEALNIPKKSIDGSVTSFQKKGLVVREPAEMELADGTHKAVKLIRITDAGREFDPEANN